MASTSNKASSSPTAAAVGKPSDINSLVGLDPREHDKVKCCHGYLSWLIDVTRDVRTLGKNEHSRAACLKNIIKIKDHLVRWLRKPVDTDVAIMITKCICEICTILPFLDQRDLALRVMENHVQKMDGRMDESESSRCSLVLGKLYRSMYNGREHEWNFIEKAETSYRNVLDRLTLSFADPDDDITVTIAKVFWEPSSSVANHNDAQIFISTLASYINLLAVKQNIQTHTSERERLKNLLNAIEQAAPSASELTDKKSWYGCIQVMAKSCSTLSKSYLENPMPVSDELAKQYALKAGMYGARINDQVSIEQSIRNEAQIDIRPFQGLEDIISLPAVHSQTDSEMLQTSAQQELLLQRLHAHTVNGNTVHIKALERDLQALNLHS